VSIGDQNKKRGRVERKGGVYLLKREHMGGGGEEKKKQE